MLLFGGSREVTGLTKVEMRLQWTVENTVQSGGRGLLPVWWSGSLCLLPVERLVDFLLSPVSSCHLSTFLAPLREHSPLLPPAARTPPCVKPKGSS